MSAAAPPRGLLATVVVGQLLALSVWFSASAVAPELRAEWRLDDAQAALLATSVQIGFVAGTLLFAALNVADRLPPHRLLVASIVAAAGANALVAAQDGFTGALLLRLLTGFALAGVYPVGMKLLATWYPSLGLALGVMVGALALGGGLPYLVRAIDLPWRAVVLVASGLALGGALVSARVRPGPLLPARAPFRPRMFLEAFAARPFRRAALGYFGHMWELYVLWGLLPLFLAVRFDDLALVAGLTFLVFLAGAAGSVAGGLLSRRIGEARVATGALVASATCCILSPWALFAPLPVLAAFLAFWGASAVADSAMFSALLAEASPRAYVGTALTVQVAIGFAITVVSLQLVPVLAGAVGWRYALVALAPGPLLGALAMRRLAQPQETAAMSSTP